MNSLLRSRVCVLLAVTAAPLIAVSAAAQNAATTLGPTSDAPAESSDTADVGLHEITISAQRRDENLQSVPISVTALSEATLQSFGITTTADLGRVTPGFQFQQSIGLAAPYIRGIGVAGQQAGLESSVATYVDGVYMAGGASALMTLNNIERIEVLKGPQGTLFGRNASGGLVQVITRDPTYGPHLQGSLSYDRWQTVTGSAYATGGLSEKIAADVAVRYSEQGQGWGDNRLTGDDVNKVDHDLSLRSKWVFDLSESSTLKIAGDYGDTRATTFVTFSPVPGHEASGNFLFTGNPWDSVSGLRNPLRHSEGWGVSADYTNDLGIVSVHSITAYRDSRFLADFDPGALSLPTVTIHSLIEQEQLSQEIQLLSQGPSALKWIAGLYYFRGDSGGSRNDVSLYPLLTFAPGEIDTLQRAGNTINSLAGYAQATYPLGDRVSLTGGIRYTRDQYVYRNTTTSILSFVPPAFGGITTVDFPERRGSTSKPSWRLAIDSKISASTLVYASYNRGFKSGGYDIQAETGPELKPETVDSYEVGTKIDALDRRVRFNVAAFYQTVDNLQLVVLFNGVSNIRNAASTRAYGSELELTVAPVAGLTLTASGNYLHSRFHDFFGNAPITTPIPGGGNIVNTNGNATGNQTPRQPDETLTLSANYETPFVGGTLGLFGSGFRSAKWYTDPDNRLYQPAYTLLAAEISWTDPSGNIRYKVFGRNLTNADVGAQFGELLNGDVRSLIEPRTIGGAIEVKF